MSLNSDFEAEFPELLPLDNDIYNNAVNKYPLFDGRVYDETVDNKDNIIILYLIAHLYYSKLRNSGSPNPQEVAKDISSKSVGSVSVTYNTPQNTTNRQAYFMTTSYGQQYLIMTYNNFGAVFV